MNICHFAPRCHKFYGQQNALDTILCHALCAFFGIYVKGVLNGQLAIFRLFTQNKKLLQRNLVRLVICFAANAQYIITCAILAAV